jgi:hypothetical protein
MTALLVALALVSIAAEMSIGTTRLQLYVGRGDFVVQWHASIMDHSSSAPSPGFHMTEGFSVYTGYKPAFRWGAPSFETGRLPGYSSLYLPSWLLILSTFVISAVLWFRCRFRDGSNRCNRCAYDLTGNVSGVCPECGHAVAITRVDQAP